MARYVNLAAVRFCTQAEGPGKRFALWVQGCLQRCEGCCNQQMQKIRAAHIVEVQDVIQLIKKAKTDFGIEGISFIGGEPLLQAEGLSQIAVWCRQNELSVLVFTGFLYETLQNSPDESVQLLLQNTDILVDGLYDQSQPDTKRDWIGSKNQRCLFLSDRYKLGIEYEKSERAMEILVSEKDILANGWPF